MLGGTLAAGFATTELPWLLLPVHRRGFFSPNVGHGSETWAELTFPNRDIRLKPHSLASFADDCYFGSTGGVNIFLFRLHFLVQLSTM